MQTFSSFLRPELKEVFVEFLSRLEAEGAEFVTFDLEDGEGWIQVVLEENRIMVNCAYPHGEDPDGFIRQQGIILPEGYKLLAWEPETYVTFAIRGCSHEELAFLLDVLFTRLLGAPPDYKVDAWFP